MKECPKCGLTNPDSAQRCDCGWDFRSETLEKSYLTGNAAQVTASAAYEILPNGKKRYLKATIVDIAFCLLLPFWGLLIGAVAFGRGEYKRGQTMMLLGVVSLVVVVLLRTV